MKSPALATPITACLLAAAAFAQPPLGNPPVPAGNPITEPKRLLGKALFWDEQLSSSNTVACATCHAPQAGGGDPRRARNPGVDGALFTGDDVFASPGVVATDSSNNFSPSPQFLFASQVTTRSAQSAYMAAYSELNFWDGRAGPALVDPQTGQTVMDSGAALEAQAVQPPLSVIEMAHFTREWDDAVTKLAAARPLALVDQVPPDLAAALADDPTYPALFQRAFGTPDVTAARVVMAIAAYERTLVPNQAPWDRYAAGDASALTANQVLGLTVFNSSAARCAECHTGNTFTDNSFHAIGVRPYQEDTGRESETGVPDDRGKFKTPTLRNAGLRNSFFHNGVATTLRQTVDFYTRASGALPQFTENLDPGVTGITLTSVQADAIVDFIAAGLTDPRVAASLPPFDHPRLWSQRTALAPVSLGGGVAGPGFGQPPLALALDPALIGEQCRLGVGNAPHGWHASVRIDSAPPVNGVVTGGDLLPPLTITGEGVATAHFTLDGSRYTAGTPLYVQWELSPSGGGVVAARSDVAVIIPFCPRGGCQPHCPADLGSQGGLVGSDGLLNNNDFIAFISLFFAQAPAADLGVQGGFPGSDGHFDNNDFIQFIQRFFEGC